LELQYIGALTFRTVNLGTLELGKMNLIRRPLEIEKLKPVLFIVAASNLVMLERVEKTAKLNIKSPSHFAFIS
jgi:hypothetical protein